MLYILLNNLNTDSLPKEAFSKNVSHISFSKYALPSTMREGRAPLSRMGLLNYVLNGGEVSISVRPAIAYDAMKASVERGQIRGIICDDTDEFVRSGHIVNSGQHGKLMIILRAKDVIASKHVKEYGKKVDDPAIDLVHLASSVAKTVTTMDEQTSEIVSSAVDKLIN